MKSEFSLLQARRSFLGKSACGLGVTALVSLMTDGESFAESARVVNPPAHRAESETGDLPLHGWRAIAS